MSVDDLQIEPLSAAAGAEVLGLDLSAPLGAARMAAVERAWYRYKVLLFRGQDLSEEGQFAFARQFGPLQKVRSAVHLTGDNVYAMHVSNREVNGQPGLLPEGEMQFHADQCYYERPCKATILYGIEIPKAGGNTCFIDTVQAYQRLADADKRRLQGLRALHVYDYDAAPTIKGAVTAAAPQFVHPVVIRHPATGQPALYVNRLMTFAIEGLAAAESDALLERLFTHMEQPDQVYEHRWRPGDLLMWDNFATLHARTGFDPAERRVLRRVAVEGPRPAAARAVA